MDKKKKTNFPNVQRLNRRRRKIRTCVPIPRPSHLPIDASRCYGKETAWKTGEVARVSQLLPEIQSCDSPNVYSKPRHVINSVPARAGNSLLCYAFLFRPAKSQKMYPRKCRSNKNSAGDACDFFGKMAVSIVSRKLINRSRQCGASVRASRCLRCSMVSQAVQTVRSGTGAEVTLLGVHIPSNLCFTNAIGSSSSPAPIWRTPGLKLVMGSTITSPTFFAAVIPVNCFQVMLPLPVLMSK